MTITRVSEMHALPAVTTGSIAFCLPAHNEAENLAATVAAVQGYLESRGAAYQIIIVDDGSTDGTAEVAQALQQRYYPFVEVIRHEQNRGYGGALRSFLLSGAQTNCDWVVFCDSDGQFNPADAIHLMAAAEIENAGIAAGIRIKRADSRLRRFTGRAWHHLSNLILPVPLDEIVSDIDCGFKAFRRTDLMKFVYDLAADGAAISPEIIARAHLAGVRITQTEVPHYPRSGGIQSGLKLKVVIRSLQHLLWLRRTLRAQLAKTA